MKRFSDARKASGADNGGNSPISYVKAADGARLADGARPSANGGRLENLTVFKCLDDIIVNCRW